MQKKIVAIVLCAILMSVLSIALIACNDASEELTVDDGAEIIFVLNNGEEDVVCEHDDPFPIPIWNGYIFEGWYLDLDFTKEVSETDITQLIDDDTSTTLRVYAKWKRIENFTGVLMRDAFLFYDGNSHLPTVEGLPDGAEVEYEGGKEYIDAGEYEVSAVVSAYGYNDLRLTAKLTIARAEIDTSALKFEDAVFVWDGLEKSIELKGELPDGVSVSYEGNGNSEVGEYTVTAKFDVGKNYQQIEDMTATLTIKERCCTVTFIEEDGSSFTREVGYGKSLIDIPMPSLRRGYVGGWIGADFENICENITVRAVYTLEVYNIELILNGGILDGDKPTAYTVLESVRLPAPSRRFFTFAGWYESEDFSGEAMTEIAADSVGDKCFYAKWIADEYTVTFEPNGGVNHLHNTTDGTLYKYTAESAPLTLVAATRDGYSFVRWADEDGNTVTAIYSETPTDFTLYAEWEAVVYHISYELSGGVNSYGYVDSYTVEDGDIALPLPLKSGYDFGGWHLLESLNDAGVMTLPASSTARDVVLYAEWILIEYEISYELNGGDNSLANPAVYTVENGILTLDCAKRAGYMFAGWYTNSDFMSDEVYELNAEIDGSVILYAKWEIVTYSITYFLDGGENNGDNPASYTVEDGVIPLFNASKENCEFDGWYPTADLYGEPMTEIDCARCESIELYAKWKEAQGGGEKDPDDNDKKDKRFTVELVDGRNIITACDYTQGKDIMIPKAVGDVKIDGVAVGVLSEAESIEILAEWKELDEDIFKGCTALRSVILPSTLTRLSDGMFADCISIEHLTLPFAGDIPYYSNDGLYLPLAVLFGTEEKSDCYAVTVMSMSVIGGVERADYNDMPDRYIPNTLRSVTVLGGNIIAYAFYGLSSVTEIEIKGDCTSIGDFAFRDCSSLKVLKLPEGVTSLTRLKIYTCKNIERIYVYSGADIEGIKTALTQVGCGDAEIIVYGE